MARRRNDTQFTSQLGSPYGYLQTLLGEVVYDSDVSVDEYREMLQKDETVAAAVSFLAKNIVNYLGNYTHPNPEVAEFVKLNFENLSETLERVATDLVTDAIVYGFAVAEKIYEEKEGKLVLKKLVTLPPSTLSFVLENGKITVRQTTLSEKVELPAEKVVILKFGRDVYGNSMLRPVFRAYKFKQALMKFWAVAMERYAMPVLHAKTFNVDAAVEALKNLWTQGIIATDKDSEINLLEPRSNVADVFKYAIEYMNLLILRGFGIPSLLVSTSETGTYNLAAVQHEIFKKQCMGIADQLADTLIDQVVAQVIELNFGIQEDYGKFVREIEMQTSEIAQFTQALMNLYQVGLLNVSDFDWIRQKLGFPEETEEPEDEELERIWETFEPSTEPSEESKTELPKN